jgi:hypothetical protein
MCIALKILNIETGNAGGIGIQYFQDTSLPKYQHNNLLAQDVSSSSLICPHTHTQRRTRASINAF